MLASGRDRNSITVNDKGVIVIDIRGAQDRGAVMRLREEVTDAINDLRAAGKRILIFADISHIKPGDVSSGARQEGRALMTEFKVDRAAVYGRGRWATFMMYLLRVTGMGRRFRFFMNKGRAQKWLLQGEGRPKRRDSSIGLVVGSVILLIGLTAFLGWYYNNPYLMSWFPALRPMNPLAALGLVIGGLGFLFYWLGRPEVLRWLAGGGLLLGSVGDLLRQAEVQRPDGAGLHAEGLLVLADPIAAHGALARLAGDVVFRDHIPGAGMDAVLTPDANVGIDDDGAFFVFGDCFDGAHGGAGGEGAMHAAVARPGCLRKVALPGRADAPPARAAARAGTVRGAEPRCAGAAAEGDGG